MTRTKRAFAGAALSLALVAGLGCGSDGSDPTPVAATTRAPNPEVVAWEAKAGPLIDNLTNSMSIYAAGGSSKLGDAMGRFAVASAADHLSGMLPSPDDKLDLYLSNLLTNARQLDSEGVVEALALVENRLEELR